VPKHLLLRWSLGAFLVGIALASFLTVPAWAMWTMAFGGSVLLLFRRPALLLSGLLALMLLLGLWRTQSALNHPSALWDSAGSGSAVTLAGYADGDFSLTASGRGKWTLRVQTADGVAINGRAVIYGQNWVRPRYGQALTVKGKLTRPENTGDFDYISYLAKDGISAQMSFPEYGVPVGLRVPWHVRLRVPLFAARDALNASLARSVGGDEAAYMGGILLGTRGTLDPALADAFSATGTSHVLAVSGYNITIVAGVLMYALAWAGRTRAYWLTVAGIVLFAVLTGASASVVRAALMGIIALTAVHMGRRGNAGIAILVAAAAMTAVNPALLRWDAGFQLSFLAVLGIVYLEPLIAPSVLRAVRWKPLASMVSTTIAAQLAVLPLILFSFGNFAVYALPVNLVVLGLVPVAMALGFAAGTAGLVLAPLGAFVGQAAWLVAAVQLSVIRFAAALPHASLDLRISAPLLVASYVALATALILQYRGRPWNAHSSSLSPTPSSAGSSGKSFGALNARA
jgi:competence protein ComEC